MNYSPDGKIEALRETLIELIEELRNVGTDPILS